MNTVTTVLVTLGAMLVSAIALALPILATLSFVFNWTGFVKMLLVLATSGEYFVCAFAMVQRSDDT